jgi:PiT family inorganic phosphate transporter
VSTTHTVAGAITGVGTTNRGTTVHWNVFGRLAVAWIVTMPAAGIVACLAYLLTTKLPSLVSVIVMTVLLLALTGALVVSLRRAPRAGDVEPRPGEEVTVGMRPGAGSAIDLQAVPASREVLEHGGSQEEARAAAEREVRQRQPL